MAALRFGVSTSCYYPKKTEYAASCLTEAGVDCTELFFNADSELSGERFEEIRRIFSAGKTEVLSVHPFTSGFEPMLFFSDYERRFLESVEYYKKYFFAAAQLGADLVIFHGDRSEGLLPETQYFERYACLAQTARRYGVCLAQENVSRCRGRSLDFLKRMKAALGNDAAFVLDLKQAIRSGVDYHDVFSALGPSIRHLHVSDHTQAQDCLPIGEGDFDFSVFLRELGDYHYSGGVILELYRQNYRTEEDLLKAYRRMKRAAADF